MDSLRSETMKLSIESLLQTTKQFPVEIIVVENKGRQDDSAFFIDLLNENKIHCYIKNSSNLSFGFGRNQGLASAKGNYIVIADNY